MTAESFRLGVEQALAVAVLRRVERQAEIMEAVQAAESAGVFVPFTAPELWRLEAAGLRYDMRAGTFTEVRS